MLACSFKNVKDVKQQSNGAFQYGTPKQKKYDRSPIYMVDEKNCQDCFFSTYFLFANLIYKKNTLPVLQYLVLNCFFFPLLACLFNISMPIFFSWRYFFIYFFWNSELFFPVIMNLRKQLNDEWIAQLGS